MVTGESVSATEFLIFAMSASPRARADPIQNGKRLRKPVMTPEPLRGPMSSLGGAKAISYIPCRKTHDTP